MATAKEEQASGIKVFCQWAVKSNTKSVVFQWCLNYIKTEHPTIQQLVYYSTFCSAAAPLSLFSS